MRPRPGPVRATLTLLILFLSTLYGNTQGIGCPVNIGFESGTLANWVCYKGNIDGSGLVYLDPDPPEPGRHTVIANTNPALDPYGLFPVVCPNGSQFSAQLGNRRGGAEAERMAYTFTIPANASEYTIIFNYAVVLQNPDDHLYFEQPRFTASVFDVSQNANIDCASFDFIAAPNLPGFIRSSVNREVFYKDWSSVTINLSGYAGHTIRLEFTTNDCSRGGHFGYAYLDVEQNCLSSIKGNVYCGNPASITLLGPNGFYAYEWYNANFTQLLGTSSSLTLSPPPPNGTTYALILYPWPNQGCKDTIYATVQSAPEPLDLVVKDTVTGCLRPGVDITQPAVTAGSSPGLQYAFYTDPLGTTYVPSPRFIRNSGTYYIAATNAPGCRTVKPVYVKVRQPPPLQMKSLIEGCPWTTDLTDPTHILTTAPNVTYTYWLDSNFLFPFPQPNSVRFNGMVYVKSTDANGCYSVSGMQVAMPLLKTTERTGCGSADLSSVATTRGSSPGFTLSYWRDPQATQPLNAPNAVTTSGVYYIKGVQAGGCTDIQPVNAFVSPLPDFTVTDPAPVLFPATVSLFGTAQSATPYTYTYWKDAGAFTTLPSPGKVAVSGTYYIQAVNNFGCVSIKPVKVLVIPPPPVKVEAVNAFSPNGDGINDFFQLKVTGMVQVAGIRIFNRWGQEVYETRNQNFYWDGSRDGKPLPAGVYYWLIEGRDIYWTKPVVYNGSITLVR